MTNIEDDKAASAALAPVPADQLTNYEGQIQYAQLIAKSQIMPAHLRGNPGNCLAVISIAMNWGMNPILVGLKTSVIPKKGGGETLMFEGQLVQAAINNSRKLVGRMKFDLSGKDAATVCIARGTIKGESEERTVTVTMPKTQNSPLWSGTQTDKEQQLTYLAARVWCRRHLPEILLGVYTPEDDFTDRDDAHTQRRDQVSGQLAALENNPSMPTGIPADRDDFIDADPVPVAGAASDDPEKVASPAAQTGRQITDNPEDRQPEDGLEEPIPDFAPKCEQCDGTGKVDGKPCKNCNY